MDEPRHGVVVGRGWGACCLLILKEALFFHVQKPDHCSLPAGHGQRPTCAGWRPSTMDILAVLVMLQGVSWGSSPECRRGSRRHKADTQVQGRLKEMVAGAERIWGVFWGNPADCRGLSLVLEILVRRQDRKCSFMTHQTQTPPTQNSLERVTWRWPQILCDLYSMTIFNSTQISSLHRMIIVQRNKTFW